jgi:hypothetical protein
MTRMEMEDIGGGDDGNGRHKRRRWVLRRFDDDLTMTTF